LQGEVVPSLPDEWVTHLNDPVSARIGSADADGRPSICRGLGTRIEDDGSVCVAFSRKAGQEVAEAIGQTGHVSVVWARPTTHRTLHLKGRDGRVTPADAAMVAHTFEHMECFAREIETLGFTREQVTLTWYAVAPDDLVVVRFGIAGAWNQTPGPGAGAPIDLRA
jgi:hypothetical protein